MICFANNNRFYYGTRSDFLLYSNIIRATPFFGTSPKKPVQTLSRKTLARCFSFAALPTGAIITANAHTAGFWRSAVATPSVTLRVTLPQAPQDGSNHKANHYKQPFAFVPLVAKLSVVRPQCGRTSPKEAPRSTASKGCFPLVYRSGEQLRTVQRVALFLFYYFVVGGVKWYGLYFLLRENLQPEVSPLDTESMFA